MFCTLHVYFLLYCNASAFVICAIKITYLLTRWSSAANRPHVRLRREDAYSNKCFLTVFGLVTLTFDLLTSKSKQFIYVPNCKFSEIPGPEIPTGGLQPQRM